MRPLGTILCAVGVALTGFGLGLGLRQQSAKPVEVKTVKVKK